MILFFCFVFETSHPLGSFGKKFLTKKYLIEIEKASLSTVKAKAMNKGERDQTSEGEYGDDYNENDEVVKDHLKKMLDKEVKTMTEEEIKEMHGQDSYM